MPVISIHTWLTTGLLYMAGASDVSLYNLNRLSDRKYIFYVVFIINHKSCVLMT